MLEHITYLGTKLPSFHDASEAVSKILRTTIGEKRVERITERIGGERVVQRQEQVAAWSKLKLTEKEAAPPGVKAPEVASVMADGGRLQLRDPSPDAKSHWHEYKCGALQSLSSEVSTSDPFPQIPGFFLNQERMDKLSREIAQVAARVDSPNDNPATDTPSASEISATVLATVMGTEKESGVIDDTPPKVLEREVVATCQDRRALKQPSTEEISATVAKTEGECGAIDYLPPEVVEREVVATRQNSRAFGQHLASVAWALGFFAAKHKAFVGDGQNWIWTEWERHFKPYGFVPILDFIHALTHVYAAAMADRPAKSGWPIYVRWITAVWNGDVASVISELAIRQQELGLPTPEDGDTSPRTLVTKTLTYLQNQQSRMNYPEYRRLGLPITSALMESTVKQVNRRLKGSEKFWSDHGAEELLQLVGDEFSTTQPMAEFWRTRAENQTGYRTYSNRAA